MEQRIEKRKHYLYCNIAGFMYWDGCEALGELKVGKRLTLVREHENKYDPEAVAIYYGDMKLGFVPRGDNEDLSHFLDMGHSDLFEVRVARLCADAHPDKQVFVNIFIRRKQ